MRASRPLCPQFLLALLWVALPAVAAPPLTTIQDVLYKADGSLFAGSVYVQWKSFTASDNSLIAMNSISVPIVNGVIRLRLVPTTTASSGAYYTVRYNADGKTQFTEVWTVPAVSTPVRVKDVRVASPPGTTAPPPATAIQISDVTGLTEALADRLERGAGFVGGRVAFISLEGDINAVSGSPSDCIRADGTAGPCGTSSGGGLSISFYDHEVPAGTLDGANGAFVLLRSPNPAGSLHVYRNGVLQKAGSDFNLSGATLNFVPGAIPQPGDSLTASYRVAN